MNRSEIETIIGGKGRIGCSLESQIGQLPSSLVACPNIGAGNAQFLLLFILSSLPRSYWTWQCKAYAKYYCTSLREGQCMNSYQNQP